MTWEEFMDKRSAIRGDALMHKYGASVDYGTFVYNMDDLQRAIFDQLITLSEEQQ